jgi:UDP-N-acetylmuramoyl-tripeptide--D-alanyl-D-alanine ligase
MSIESIYEIFLEFPKCSTDSRKIEPESIFFALKGGNFNGNQYALEALHKGAAFAVVDEKEYAIDSRFILVPDVLKTLQNLALHHRLQLKTPILAITGTNGKTTTKELVSNVLAQKFSVSYTQGNLNNHIGVPLTLLSFSPETEIGIVEMGANHPGDIKELCEIAWPDYGLITNVGIAHIEGFGSFDMVKKTKAELYRFLENKGGRIFIHSENEHLAEMAGNLNRFSYGTSENSDIFAQYLSANPFLELNWWPNRQQSPYLLKSKLTGKYNFENIMAAIAVGTFFTVEKQKIKEAIEHYVPQNSRSQLVEGQKNTLFLDAYNANPSSMDVSLENFFEYKAGAKAVVLGDMLELGEISEREHQKIVDKLLNYQFDKVFLVGKNFCKTNVPNNFHLFVDVNELIAYITENKLNAHTILIKGSNGIRLDKTIEHLK